MSEILQPRGGTYKTGAVDMMGRELMNLNKGTPQESAARLARAYAEDQGKAPRDNPLLINSGILPQEGLPGAEPDDTSSGGLDLLGDIESAPLATPLRGVDQIVSLCINTVTDERKAAKALRGILSTITRLPNISKWDPAAASQVLELFVDKMSDESWIGDMCTQTLPMYRNNWEPRNAAHSLAVMAAVWAMTVAFTEMDDTGDIFDGPMPVVISVPDVAFDALVQIRDEAKSIRTARNIAVAIVGEVDEDVRGTGSSSVSDEG